MKARKWLEMRLFRFTLRAVSLALLVILGVAVVASAHRADRPIDVGTIRPMPSVDPAAAVVAAHGCWTGDAPADMAGKFPGHVVVRRDGHVVYGGQRLVGQALDQLFANVDHGLAVVAFCR
jgi:hypothetical protein